MLEQVELVFVARITTEYKQTTHCYIDVSVYPWIYGKNT